MLPREVGRNAPVVPLPEPAPRAAEFPLGERPAAPPALSSGPDGLALLRAFRRRWLLALTLGVLAAAGAGAAVYFLLPASYQVSAQIQVASTAQSILPLGNNGDGRGEWTTYLKTQMGYIRSRYVLAAALRRDEVKRLEIVRQQADPFVWLEEELKVESPEGSELVSVTMTGSSPDELVPLVGAIADAYLKQVQEVDTKRRQDRIAELTKVHDRFKDQLRTKRNNWHDLANRLNTSDSQTLNQKQLLLLSTFGETRRQHSQIRFELERARTEMEQFQAQEKLLADLPVPEAKLSEAIDADPIAREHLAKIARWDELISRYDIARNKESEPGYREATRRRAEVQQKLNARREELRGTLLQRIRQEARAQYDATLAAMQQRVGALAKQEEGLREEVKQLAADAEKIGNSSTELEMLAADIKRDEGTLSQMAGELERLKAELNALPRVSLYQEAAALRKDRKRQLLAMIGAPLVAFLGVCFAVSWWEFHGRRIQTPDEVLTGLGLRVVGSVPALPRNAAVPLLPEDEGQTELEHSVLESIDGIRTLLLRESSVEAARVLMVTSAVSGEGKTTLATHLAGSLARAGRRTLLIDCDLRRPSIHQLFELPPQPGFSEVLLGEVHLAEATRATPVDGLWVIAAGQWDRNVMQALARDEARAVFEKLKAEYDFVIVDSHPVLPATDSLLIGQHADAVLVALLRDVSAMPKVYAACQRLTSLGIRVLGAVVNGTQEDDYGSSYQYAAPAQQA